MAGSGDKPGQSQMNMAALNATKQQVHRRVAELNVVQPWNRNALMHAAWLKSVTTLSKIQKRQDAR
jgi:hypothetical protein